MSLDDFNNDSYRQLCEFYMKQLKISCFQCLCREMHGCYPLMIQRLIKATGIKCEPCELHRTFYGWNTPLITPPFPHIIDGDWRYSTPTTARLIDFAHRSQGRTAACIHLGSPSTYKTALASFPGTGYHYLYDRNALLHRVNNFIPPAFSGFDVAFLDPPWYKDETYLFLRIASDMLSSDGIALVAQPSILTRPNVQIERYKFLEFARSLGFLLIGELKNFLRYETPHFEYVTLKKTLRIPVPSDWRTGDLIVLSLTRKSKIINDSIECSYEREWIEKCVGPVRFMIREVDDFPPFYPINSDCVARSVSRRDILKEKVGVWTSGNRIFGCNSVDDTLIILSQFNLLLRRCELKKSTVIKILIDSGLDEACALVSSQSIVEDMMEHLQHGYGSV